MTTAEHKHLNRPDESREFPRGRMDLVTLAGGTIGRLTLEPGWRWSEHVKPIAQTDLCEAPHFQYQVSGLLRIKMQDGMEFDSNLAMLHRYRPATMRGYLETSRWSWWTGMAQATTPSSVNARIRNVTVGVGSLN